MNIALGPRTALQSGAVCLLEVLSLATTRLIPHHISSGKSILQSLADRFDYGKNPDKTLDGKLIRAYECDPMTADAEFLLAKAKYKAITGREQKRDADILCYQIRQSFPSGELSVEEALDIGYELAMRWTKGKHAFFVVSHADRPHPHVHIYYNAISLDTMRKYRNFWGSSLALRRLSDRVCLEHDLSVIQNPKLHSKGKYLHYGEWLGESRQPSYKEQIRVAIDMALSSRPTNLSDFLHRMETSGVQVVHGRGGVISFRLNGQERATRWRSATLGLGYGPEDIQAVIDGNAPIRKRPKVVYRPVARRVNLIIDIQERLAQGKGPGYERWAKVYNLKQMAAALQYLQENGLTDYEELSTKAEGSVDRAHTLAKELQSVETQLAATSALMGAIVDYAKTRPIFDGYKESRYSKTYRMEHESELDTYRAAKASMNEILCGNKLPKINELKASRKELVQKKKSLYADYRKAQREMRELITVKGNIDYLLNAREAVHNKEQER